MAYSARSFLTHEKKIFTFLSFNKRGEEGKNPHGFWSLNIKALYQHASNVVSNAMPHISSVPSIPCHALPST